MKNLFISPGNGIRTNNHAFHLKLHTSSHPLTTTRTVARPWSPGPPRRRTVNQLGKSRKPSRLSLRCLPSRGGIFGKLGRSTDFKGTVPRCSLLELTCNRRSCLAPWLVQTCTRISRLRATRIVISVTWYRTVNTLRIRRRRVITTFSATKRSSVSRSRAASRARSISWNTRLESRIKPEPWCKLFAGWNVNSRRTLLRVPVGSTFTNTFITTITIIIPRLLFDSYAWEGENISVVVLIFDW